MPGPERWTYAEGASASRVICGLWQVADLEKTGTILDPERAADALEAYVAAGFDTFDMADHYGSAELIAGRLLARYDRVLAYVYRWSDDLFVNLELARAGYADALTIPPNVAHTAELTAAVAEARREQRGLWQACTGFAVPA